MGSLVLREATKDEHVLVLETWVRSFAPKEHRVGDDPVIHLEHASMAPPVWYRMHRLFVSDCIPKSTVLVAAHRKLPEEALGWVCFNRDGGVVRIQYVFTKRRARRRGIGTALVRAAAEGAERVRVSHENREGRALLAAALATDEQDRRTLVADRA